MNELLPIQKIKKSASSALICVLFLFLFLFLLSACGQASGTETATPTPLPTPVAVEKPTYMVQRGTVARVLTVTGRVSPVAEQRLFFRSDGFVRDVLVVRDAMVEAGDLLAELEIGRLENGMAQAQLALQTAETNLARAEQSNQDAIAEAEIQLETIRLRLQRAEGQTASSAVVSAQFALTQAQQGLAYAQEEYAKALDRPWEPEQAIESYARMVTQAEQNLTLARVRYNEALAGQGSLGFDRQIIEQELALAELRLEQLQRGVDLQLTLEVERANLAIARLERQIADAQLIAPFSGQILSVNVQPGANAEAFRPVLVLADPSALEITVELSAADLNQLSVGMPVTALLRNRPGAQPMTGFIRQMPLTGAAAGAVQQEDRLTRIGLTDEMSDLELGELATLTIILEEREEVLWLPPAALRAFQGRNFVVVQDGDVQRRVDVRLGIQSDDRVEILEGLAPGQIVVGP
jgi:RND family efflux transporter MFP subunit